MKKHLHGVNKWMNMRMNQTNGHPVQFDAILFSLFTLYFPCHHFLFECIKIHTFKQFSNHMERNIEA